MWLEGIDLRCLRWRPVRRPFEDSGVCSGGDMMKLGIVQKHVILILFG